MSDPKLPCLTWPIDWTDGYADPAGYQFTMRMSAGANIDEATITFDSPAAYGFGYVDDGSTWLHGSQTRVFPAETDTLADDLAADIVTSWAASTPSFYTISGIEAWYITGRDEAHVQYALVISTTGDPATLEIEEITDPLVDIGMRTVLLTGKRTATRLSQDLFLLTSNGNARGWWQPNRELSELNDNRRIITRRRSSEFAPGSTTHVRLGEATTYDPAWRKVDGFYITDRRHALTVYAQRAGMDSLVIAADAHNTMEELLEQIGTTPEFRLWLAESVSGGASGYVTARFRDEAELDTAALATPVASGGTRFDVSLPLIRTT